MKPYDQCFMYDSYNDMAGPIEVEQVTNIFSSETGFVTCIVPDLVVQQRDGLDVHDRRPGPASWGPGSATRRMPLTAAS